jgi:DNA invertase Pin-like site-specific DNA recombinase
MVAEFESDLIRLRTREGMKVAKSQGHAMLRGVGRRRPGEASTGLPSPRSHQMVRTELDCGVIRPVRWC